MIIISFSIECNTCGEKESISDLTEYKRKEESKFLIIATTDGDVIIVCHNCGNEIGAEYYR